MLIYYFFLAFATFRIHSSNPNEKTESLLSKLQLSTSESDLRKVISEITQRLDNISQSLDTIYKRFDLLFSNRSSQLFTLKQTLTGHEGRVESLAVLPTGDLVSGSWDETIKIWRPERADKSLTRTIVEHTDKVRSLIVLSNGDLASASDDRSIKIWNLNDASLKKTIRGHSDWVTSLSLLRNGNLVSALELNLTVFSAPSAAFYASFLSL
jgi:WD40 repeat protein